jgi:DNA polymerase delta subunit 2
MIEDESGRLRLIGSPLQAEMLVTGCILAILGTENANGEFDVIDIKVPDLAPQPARWSKVKNPAESNQTSNKIAVLSGLDISGSSVSTLSTELLVEYLLGESLAPNDQQNSSQISRLIVCGNSLSDAAPLPTHEEISVAKKQSKKYGYDSSAYNSAPIIHLDQMISTLLSSIPVTILPGSTDPANVSLPQQPIHSAMFPQSRAFAANPVEKANGSVGWFDAVTNPWEGEVEGWRFLASGGQTTDDIFKYVESEDRLEMMERMLRWRCCAPTAPDTLCELHQTSNT